MKNRLKKTLDQIDIFSNGFVVFVLLLTIVLGVSSCDKRVDYYDEINEAPGVVLQLNNQYWMFSSAIYGTTITDTLKKGYTYDFSLTLADESDMLTVVFNGDGVLSENGASIDSLLLPLGTHSFQWVDTVIGNKIFSVSVTDGYGKIEKYDFNIHVFDNWIPQISWVVVDVGNLDPLEKKIVVSGGDKDKWYGGYIHHFEYIIDNDTSEVTPYQMKYIFPSVGLYDIGVRALDNNNEWSQTVFINNYPIN
ncbi:MAG: hypothetical protein ACJASM_000900 [Salibacteraceae bacterium]|jgi:hypothetical protein